MPFRNSSPPGKSLMRLTSACRFFMVRLNCGPSSSSTCRLTAAEGLGNSLFFSACCSKRRDRFFHSLRAASMVCSSLTALKTSVSSWSSLIFSWKMARYGEGEPLPQPADEIKTMASAACFMNQFPGERVDLLFPQRCADFFQGFRSTGHALDAGDLGKQFLGGGSHL